MIEQLKESYAVNVLCQAFEVHRSSYKYWSKRSKTIHLKKLNETDPDYVQSIVIRYNTNLTRSKWKGRNVYEYLAFIDPELSVGV